MKRFFRLFICFVFILSTVALYACGGNKGNAGDEDGEKRDYIVMPGHGERTSLLCEKENFSDFILKP